MRVQTNLNGLFLSAAISGAFIFAFARYGFLDVAPGRWTLDSIILLMLAFGLCYIAIFYFFHLLLSFQNIGYRAAYAVAGALSYTVLFYVMIKPDILQELLGNGMAIVTFLLPAALGALIGFLYHVRAGYLTDGDDPDALQNLLGLAGPTKPHPQPANNLSKDLSLADTGTAEYYNGPLQVRTSFGAMIVAAIGGILLFNIGRLFSWLIARFISTKSFDQFLNGAPYDSSENSALPSIYSYFGDGSLLENIVIFLGSGVVMAMLATIPLAAIIYAGHLIARMRDKTSYRDYFLIGLITPPLLGIFLLFAFFFIGLAAALPCAISMVIYRKYAGLEPKPVHEDIEVRDNRNLVGADHARRKYGRVIRS